MGFILGMVMISSMFIGCGSTKETEGDKTAGENQTSQQTTSIEEVKKDTQKKLHIVFVSPVIAHPVWLVAKEGFEDAQKELDFRGDWVGPSVIDANEMIKQIEIAIAEKADGIITQGINPEAMVPALKKAADANIPVVVVNSDIPNGPRIAYLGTNPDNLGKMGGEAIKKKLGNTPIKAAFMVSALDYKIGKDIVDGYKTSLSQAPGGFEEKIIAESKADMLTAVQQWQNIFNTYPDVNVAINVSGEAGAACAKVVKEMKLTDKVTIMAIDDIQETVDGIKDGTIYGTMTQNFYRKGYQASQWLLDYIKDGKKPAELINDSGTMLVTKENIDTYSTDMEVPSKW